MSTAGLEVLFVFLLILANGAFAMAEMSIVSARKERLQQWAEEGNSRAGAALEIANAPTRFLSTVQIGITLVGILSGAYGGKILAVRLAAFLNRFPLFDPYGELIAFITVVAVITYFSLVLGEIVPKRVALYSPEKIAAAVASPMRGLSVVASPAVRLLSASTDLLLRALRLTARTESPPVTEEEIKLLIEQGTRAGVFEEAEQDLVERVFRLGDLRVSSLMTPRNQIVWLDMNASAGEIRRHILESVQTRFPVGQGSLDNIMGVVHIQDLLVRCLQDLPLDLKALLKSPLFVPERMRALRLVELFKHAGVHMALVVDEYGGVQGLVTLNDVLASLVGEIGAPEKEEPQLVQREDGSWLLDGLLPVERLKGLLGLGSLPGEETETFRTVGGFVVTRLGRIPSSADAFEWGGYRFEVVDMDGKRVDKVLVAGSGPADRGANVE
ncbi:MAG: hemolysin family protein [bacterium]